MSVGGRGIPSVPRSINEMYDIAHSFPQRLVTEGVPIRAILSPYTIFREYANIFSDIDLDRRYAVIKLNYDYIDYFNMKNNIDYIVAHPKEYRFKSKAQDINKLRAQSRQIDNKFAQIEDARRKVMDRNQAIPALPMSASQFGANVLLPPRYKTYLEQDEFTVQLRRRSLVPMKHKKGTLKWQVMSMSLACWPFCMSTIAT